MSKEHRELLIKHRPAIVCDLQISEEFLSLLMPTHIITADMKEKIDVSIVFLSFLCNKVKPL